MSLGIPSVCLCLETITMRKSVHWDTNVTMLTFLQIVSFTCHIDWHQKSIQMLGWMHHWQIDTWNEEVLILIHLNFELCHTVGTHSAIHCYIGVMTCHKKITVIQCHDNSLYNMLIQVCEWISKNVILHCIFTIITITECCNEANSFHEIVPWSHPIFWSISKC